MSVQADRAEVRSALAAAIGDLAARECGTRAQRDALTDHGQETHVPELYRRMADLGYVGVGLPERYGGGGGGLSEVCVLMEAVAAGMIPAFGLGTSLIVAAAVERSGTEEQRERVLTEVATGTVKAVAISEPGAGSDAAAIRCRATPVDGGYQVDGQKTWISNAQWADEILLVCRTGDGPRRHDGLTMLLVPTDAEGVEIRPIATMGGREVNDVFFSGVRVDAARRVGPEGAAWGQLMAGLEFERTALAASVLGRAQRAFDDALAYVRERHQFGRPIGSFQVLRHRIADLATELACARLLVHDVAARCDEDPTRVGAHEASMAKLKVTETARRVALEGMQMMGGAGYALEHEMEGHVRALLVSTVYGGTSEIQRDVVGRAFGL